MAFMKLKSLILGTAIGALIYFNLLAGDSDDTRLYTRKRSESLQSTWPKRTFCHDFIDDTFHDDIPVCGREVRERDQVRCSGTVYSDLMAACSVQNLALNPHKMRSVIPNDHTWKTPVHKTVNLLQSPDVDCRPSSVKHLSERVEENDYELKLTKHLLSSEKLPPSDCNVWINKTTFFHVSSSSHIYFRFLNLYNIHKFLLDYNVSEGDYHVVRIGNIPNYHFPELDKVLYPGALSLDELPREGTICFKKVVFVPRAFQSVLFRCKRDSPLRKRCIECDGRGLSGSAFYSFRDRVLKACNIKDPTGINSRLKLVIVSRTPYKRYSGDRANIFERVLQNENKVVTKVRENFPDVHVKVVHMENLKLCEQVRYAVEADVMLGVHGAGLVHFWWLRDDAVGFELEPTYKEDNPAFKVLTSLAGRKYDSLIVYGNSRLVRVNIEHLLQKLNDYLTF